MSVRPGRYQCTADSVFDLSQVFTDNRRRGSCLSELPGAVVTTSGYLCLPPVLWRVACSCSSCLASLHDAVGGGPVTVVTPYVGPESDPAITLEMAPLQPRYDGFAKPSSEEV